MAAQPLHVPITASVTVCDCQADHHHEKQGRLVTITALYLAMVHAGVGGMDDDGRMMDRGRWTDQRWRLQPISPAKFLALERSLEFRAENGRPCTL